MPLIKNVHDGHHLHGIAVAVFRIYVVLYGYESYPECGEHIVHILSDFDIVPAEPRQVFDNDSVYDARLGII